MSYEIASKKVAKSRCSDKKTIFHKFLLQNILLTFHVVKKVHNLHCHSKHTYVDTSMSNSPHFLIAWAYDEPSGQLS